MCPSCKKNTFSAWDKMKSQPRKCSVCGIFVKPAFFRNAISMMVFLTFISPLGGIFTVDIVMKQIGVISFTYIWLMAIPFVIGAILPIIPWIKINDWFVPWVEQKV